MSKPICSARWARRLLYSNVACHLLVFYISKPPAEYRHPESEPNGFHLNLSDFIALKGRKGLKRPKEPKPLASTVVLPFREQTFNHLYKRRRVVGRQHRIDHFGVSLRTTSQQIKPILSCKRRFFDPGSRAS